VIARNTFREAMRDRVLAGVIGAGVVVLVATQVLAPLAIGEGKRLTIDLGLSAISILGLLIVMLVGTSMVAKEIERRTVFNLLSRPISRHDYLIGKWAGLSAALWAFAIALGFGLWMTLAIRGVTGHGASITEAVYMAGLELSAITSTAVLFSALSTPVLSALYTLAVYVVGQWSYDLRSFADQFPPMVGAPVHLLANVVPNLPLFNMRTLAASGSSTSVEHLVMATLYAIVYCACALCLATAAFESRDFK